MLNNAQSLSNSPRAIVKINDIAVRYESFSISEKSYYISDTFYLSLPVLGQYDETININYLSGIESAEIKIYIGFPENPDFFTEESLELMFFGIADEIEIDPKNNLANLSGRDLSSLLIDAKTSEKYPNKTSSQIAQLIAQRKGLKTNIQTTTTIVGNYYVQFQSLLNSELSEWDLLTFLAQRENFLLFVRNDTLFFREKPRADNRSYLLKVEIDSSGKIFFNGINIIFSRFMTLSGDVAVTVRYYNLLSKRSASVTVRKIGRRVIVSNAPPRDFSTARFYSFNRFNFNREQALQFAQEQLRVITKHEVTMQAEFPGDNDLRKDLTIRVDGTRSQFDQSYFVENIDREFSALGGYRMNVTAKNISQNSEVII